MKIKTATKPKGRENATSGILLRYIDRIEPKYIGHDSWREWDNLEKIIIHGIVDGTWKQGQQKLRWADGLRDIPVLGMNSLMPLSRQAQNPQVWHSFFIWVRDGQSWPVSGQKRKGIPHTLSTRIGKSKHWWFFSMVGNFYTCKSELNILTNCYTVLLSFEWVVHLKRFSFWYEFFIGCFLK